jgi:amino acid adenylation domain-containing protein
MQQALLLRCISYPDKPLYMGQWWAVLEGELDEQAFLAAWQRVVDRHSALRTGFHWDLKDHPFQVVHRQASLAITREDWSARPDWHSSLESFLADDRARPFNIKKPPLMRIALVRLAPARHLVVWTRHHLTVDGWSLGIILDEVFGLYKARGQAAQHALPPAPAFRAYVDWERSREKSAAQAYWRKVFDDMARDPADMPESRRTLTSGSAAAPQIEHVQSLLPEHVCDRLNDFARSARVTLNTVVQAAWAMVDSRVTGRDTVMFGAVETVRPPEPDDGRAGGLVGVQIQIQPVLARIDDTPVAQWLENLQARAAQARSAGAPHMDDLRELLGLPRDGLPYDSLVAFQNYPLDEAGAFAGSGLTLAESGDVTLPDMPLNLMVERNAHGLSLQLMFDVRLYDTRAARLRVDMLAAALEQMPDVPDTRVADIDILPANVARTLLDTPPLAFPRIDPDATVTHLIFEQARLQPDACAVMHNGKATTYAQLIASASAIADMLAARHIGRGTRVALHLERTPLAIAAMLAVLLRGASYVPLDTDAPEDRKAFMVSEAGIEAVLSKDHQAVGGIEPIALDEHAIADTAGAAPADTNPPLPAHADEAYVIFTSGSTGRPKGVSVHHGNLAYHVAARNAAYEGRPNSVLLLTFPLIFDGSVTGIFGTLSIGGTLVLPRPIEATDPDRLVRLIRDHGVTQTIMIPSQWSLLLSAGQPADLATLKLAVVAGEACPRDLVERHYARLPGTLLANEYGPTETTVWATVEKCRAADTGPVAIGQPIPGARAYVVDSKNRLCPPGSKGELLIASPGVANGYVNRPDLTAERFIANPFHREPGLGTAYRTGDQVVLGFDGKIRFHGRADDQVKISGYRIELAEIDACLRTLPGIDEAVAVAHAAGPRARRAIVAHVAGPDLPSEETILRHAQRFLPTYMVPQDIVLHDRLPRTAAGKIDRRALPAPAARGAAPAAPEGQIEQAIAQIWQAVLGREAVGRSDDFFAIGGRSLDAMQVVSRLRRDLKLAAELIDLFEAPRLDDLAKRLAGRGAGPDAGGSIRKRQRNRVDLTATPSPGAAQ